MDDVLILAELIKEEHQATEVIELRLPDLMTLYSPDFAWYDDVRKAIIESMGIPGHLLRA